MGAGRLFVNHMIMWPLVHILLAICTYGLSLVLTLPLQACSFVWYLCKRSKYNAMLRQQQSELGTQQHAEMMEAMRQANERES